MRPSSAPDRSRWNSAGTAARLAAAFAILLSLACDQRSTFRPPMQGPLSAGAPGTWQDLGLTSAFVEVEALTPWNGSLVAGGTFYGVDGAPSTSLASWDGTTWTRLGPDFGGAVSALAIYNGHLAVGGVFPHINGAAIHFLGEWDGATWKGFGTGPNRSVYSLAVYNGDLIAGGSFDAAGGVPASNIARWDGTAWHPLGSGLNSVPWALAVYDGQLIAGGSFSTADGLPAFGIAAWNGSSWAAVGGGVTGGPSGNPFGTVYALGVHGGSLIAGGSFTAAGGVSARNVAAWNGAQWDSLGAGLGSYSYEYVKSFAEYGDTLAAGGTFPGNVREWNGSAWIPMSSLGGFVNAMTTYDGWLVVGGYFPREAGQDANGIARWGK